MRLLFAKLLAGIISLRVMSTSSSLYFKFFCSLTLSSTGGFPTWSA